MMLTRKEVIEYIKTPKVPESGSQLVFDLNRAEHKYILKDRGNDRIKFKLDVNQSRHVSLKLSCHHRNESDFGLLRIDYNGPRHINPQITTPYVPDILHPYAGVEIPPRESHIHLYVEGDNLDWAMPLTDFSKLKPEQKDGISVAQLEINKHNDKNLAVQSFAEAIHVQANFSFNSGLMFN